MNCIANVWIVVNMIKRIKWVDIFKIIVDNFFDNTNFILIAIFAAIADTISDFKHFILFVEAYEVSVFPECQIARLKYNHVY